MFAPALSRAQGMSLVPAVTELMLAELLYLQYDSPTAPVYMYINSTGVQVRDWIIAPVTVYHWICAGGVVAHVSG